MQARLNIHHWVEKDTEPMGVHRFGCGVKNGRASREKQVPRCARNHGKKRKGKGIVVGFHDDEAGAEGDEEAEDGALPGAADVGLAEWSELRLEGGHGRGPPS